VTEDHASRDRQRPVVVCEIRVGQVVDERPVEFDPSLVDEGHHGRGEHRLGQRRSREHRVILDGTASNPTVTCRCDLRRSVTRNPADRHSWDPVTTQELSRSRLEIHDASISPLVTRRAFNRGLLGEETANPTEDDRHLAISDTLGGVVLGRALWERLAARSAWPLELSLPIGHSARML
jgi:hypothetical protein